MVTEEHDETDEGIEIPLSMDGGPADDLLEPKPMREHSCSLTLPAAAATTLDSSVQVLPPHLLVDPCTEPLHLRWSRLVKTVQIKDTNGGLLRGSIAGKRTPLTTADYDDDDDGKPAATTKIILDGVSGSAVPGTVLALIGPSGSGKTSLLNALSGRTSLESGVLSVNGQALSLTSTNSTATSSKSAATSQQRRKQFLSKVAYVQQEDIFFTHLTTRDQLTYTAFLRLPTSWSRAEKLDKVDQTIRLLRLRKVQDSQIKVLSGGEQKRVNIGTELLTNPSCLLLDEPTSGLDSTSAVALVKLLQNLARSECKTVLMSIHQPSSGMFLSFDRLLLLAEGNVVYHDSPQKSIQYLKDRGLACPEGYNAADHWMDLLVTDDSLEEEEEYLQSSRFLGEKKTASPSPSPSPSQSFRNRKTPSSYKRERARLSRQTTRQQLIDAWDGEAVAEQMDAAIVVPTTTTSDAVTTTKSFPPPRKYNTSWTTQYRVLVHRALKNTRSAIFTPLNLIKSAVLGIISGMLWFQLDYTERTIHDRSAYFFFTMTFWVFDGMFGALLAFPSERKVILKERASASYHLSAYFMAKTTSEAPTRLTLPLLYMCISFWMAGISSKFSTFVYTTLISLLSVLAGESYGLLVGASVDQMERALTVITVVALTFMLLGGFYVENVPAFIDWVKYASPFKYSFDASQSIVFEEPVPCDGSGELQDLCNNGQDYASPEAVKEFLDINGSLAFNIGMLVALGLIPRYFAYLALKMKKGGER